LHEPKFGKPIWELTKAMALNPSLPSAVRESAILVTEAHFKAAYELYAHVIVTERKGLSDEKLATIVAGQRPVDLTKQEAVAYDLASALVSGSVLPELTYRAVLAQFGPKRGSGVVLSVWPLLYDVNHAQHLRCARSGDLSTREPVGHSAEYTSRANPLTTN